MSDAATISRGARWFVLAGAAFFVGATLAPLAGLPRSTVVALGLFGFVLHTVFGKGYSLVPSYFDRRLAVPRAPTVHLPLAVAGTVGLALPPGGTLATRLPGDPATAGGVLWACGSVIFLATVGWTVRDNPTGAETATGESKAHLAVVDRIANAAMPVALGYLAVGSYETAAVATGAPSLAGTPTGVSHLLAVGTAALLVFGIGARLLPRFLRARPPPSLVGLVLATGSAGPALLVAWFAGGVAGVPPTPLLHAAIVVLGIAVVGHVALVGLLLARAPAPRVGAYGVFAGALGGLATVGAGAAIGLGHVPRLRVVHPRLGLLGFLGTTILGVAYHFYPPTIAGRYGDAVAVASILLVGGGLAVETVGVVVQTTGVAVLASDVTRAGQALVLAGAVAYAVLLVATVRVRA